jgi:hypothetical protein
MTSFIFGPIGGGVVVPTSAVVSLDDGESSPKHPQRNAVSKRPENILSMSEMGGDTKFSLEYIDRVILVAVEAQN